MSGATSAPLAADPTAPHIRILGTRGIPGRHGGFESFAEALAPYLVAAGWRVTVYCQDEGRGRARERTWEDIRLVHIPVRAGGALGTVLFDWRCTLHAAREDGIALVLGYNTAIFAAIYRLRGITTLMNMDGLEWKRGKWSWPAKAWLYGNELLGCWLSHHLFADHPEIARRLASRGCRAKVSTIAYGARSVVDADPAPVTKLGLQPGSYALVIARPEPENSILEVVRAFSAVQCAVPLVVLGRYAREHPYQCQVMQAAGSQVHFPGAIYDHDTVDALRRFARLYVHGHTLGGTNPSLIEALGAGVATLAHDNPFNRWVSGDAAEYFSGEAHCAAQLQWLLDDASGPRRAAMSAAARARHADAFSLPATLGAYERVLSAWHDRRTNVAAHDRPRPKAHRAVTTGHPGSFSQEF